MTILGYGAAALRHVNAEEGGRVLNEVLDSGINLIDTSIDYGQSEEVIGRFVGSRRDEYFLAAKCGCQPGMPDGTPHDFGPANIRVGVEQSLRKLSTDRVDLLQLHASPSPATMAANDTVATMLALRDEGKVRFIGMSGTLPNLPDQIELGVFDVFQIPYSAVQREHEDMITAAATSGAGTIIRGGAARGAPAADKQWQEGPIGMAVGLAQQRWANARIEEILDGMTPIEFVLRFTLSHPDLSSTIVGTSNVEHLRVNLANAAKGVLPGDLYAEAKRRLSVTES